MEGYVVKSINYTNDFKVINYQPDIDEMQMQKEKINIIKKLQSIFSNGTISIDT